jgi:hypothetical protein
MAIATIPTELLRCHEYGDEVKLNLGLNVVPKENDVLKLYYSEL